MLFERKQDKFPDIPSANDTPERTILSGDPRNNRAIASRDFNALVIVEEGTIQEVLPYLRFYRVALNAGPVIICTFSGDTGFTPFGVQSQTTLSVGNSVVVLRNRNSEYGIIIAVKPDYITYAGQQNADEVIQGSNVGIIADSFYREVLTNQPNRGGGIAAWSGTHVDAVAGEWVKMTDTGLSIFLDALQGGIRVNEYCGLWVNYLDSLLRVAGLNYQLWAGGSEDFTYTDWDIVWKYSGYGYLLSSQLGIKDDSSRPEAIIDIDPEESQKPESRQSTKEHKATTQGDNADVARLPQHRVQEWKGFLGQGTTKWIFGNKLYSKSQTKSTVPVPLAQEANTASGFRVIQSSKGVLIAKYPFISAPQRVAEVDEALGRPNNATFQTRADAYLSKIAEISQATSNANTGILSLSLYDIHNLFCNWDTQAGFYLYPNKFKFIKESEIANILRTFLDLRANAFSLYKASFVYMDPYGDIVFQNGSGSRIELLKDNIRITAPGGVIIDSGDNVRIFSKDVTAMAEKHLHVSGGDTAQINSGTSDGSVGASMTFYGNTSHIEGETHIEEFRAREGAIEICTTDPYQPGVYAAASQYKLPQQPWLINLLNTDINITKTTYIKKQGNTENSYLPKTMARNQPYGKTPLDVTDKDTIEGSSTVFGTEFNSIDTRYEWKTQIETMGDGLDWGDVVITYTSGE